MNEDIVSYFWYVTEYRYFVKTYLVEVFHIGTYWKTADQ